MTSLRHLEGWKLAGSCATHPDPELWFREDPPGIAEAKGVCDGCPVQATCLTDALARGEAFGVLGGLTGVERRRAAAAGGFARPSPAGAAQHGQRSRYLTCTDGPGGGKCADCRRANAIYKAGWLARRPVTPRGLLAVVHVLETPAGHGRRRAFPGQLYIPIGVSA